MISICYWPDGTWCYRHELEQMTHMSDDYSKASLPEDLYSNEEQIDQYISKLIKSSE